MKRNETRRHPFGRTFTLLCCLAAFSVAQRAAPASAQVASVLPGGFGTANPCEHNSLQDAVAAAQSGDTIHIANQSLNADEAEIGLIPSGVNLTFVSAGSDCVNETAVGDRALLVLDGRRMATVQNSLVTFENIEVEGGGNDVLLVEGGTVWFNDSIVTASSGSFGRVYGRLNMTASEVSGGSASAFVVETGGELWTYGSIIRDNSGINGGAINSSGYVSLFNTEIKNNSAEDGGGIYLGPQSGAILADAGGNEFRENHASDDGGAIHMGAATTADLRSTFVSNEADGFGGAVYMFGAEAEFSGASIVDASALFGGAVYGYDAELTMSDVSVAYGNGGAIRLLESTLTADDLSVRNCWGAGLHLYRTPANFTSVSVTDTQSGPGLTIAESDVTIDAPAGALCGVSDPCNVFESNVAGGIYLVGEGHLIVRRTWFESNTGIDRVQGAAIHIDDALATASIENSVIVDSIGAPAIMVDHGDVDLEQLTIADNNERPTSYRKGASGRIRNSIMRGNSQKSWVGGGASITVVCTNHQNFDVGAGSAVGQMNNQTVAPQFVDRANNDYRLSSSSPSVDACGTGMRPDIIGWGVAGASFDQGAYELQ